MVFDSLESLDNIHSMLEQRVYVFDVKLTGRPIDKDLAFNLVDQFFTWHPRHLFRQNIDELGVALGEGERIPPNDHSDSPVKFDVLLPPEMEKIGEIYTWSRTVKKD